MILNKNKFSFYIIFLVLLLFIYKTNLFAQKNENNLKEKVSQDSTKIDSLTLDSVSIGKIFIKSNIKIGKIIVDTTVYDSVSFPYLVDSLKVGYHKIIVEKSINGFRYTAFKEVKVLKDTIIHVELNVKIPKASILVKSIPQQATVYLNGKEKGITPIEIKDVLPGNYELEIKKEGFISYSTRLKIFTDKRLMIKAVLSPQITPDTIKYFYDDKKKIASISFATIGAIFSILAISENIKANNYEDDGDEAMANYNAIRTGDMLDLNNDGGISYYNEALVYYGKANDARDKRNLYMLLTFISINFSIPLWFDSENGKIKIKAKK